MNKSECLIKRIECLYEDQEFDRVVRRDAVLVFNKIKKWVEKNREKINDEFKFEDSFLIPKRELGTKFDVLLSVFVVDEGERAAFTVKGDNMVIKIKVLTQSNKLLGTKELTKDPFFADSQSSFIHEYTHFIDYNRVKKNNKVFFNSPLSRKISAKNLSDMEKYFNDPFEINAFYQGTVEEIERGFNMFLSKGMKGVRDFKRQIRNGVEHFGSNEKFYHSNFKKFFDIVVKKRSDFFKSLTDKNLKKVKKRFAVYHQTIPEKFPELFFSRKKIKNILRMANG